MFSVRDFEEANTRDRAGAWISDKYIPHPEENATCNLRKFWSGFQDKMSPLPSVKRQNSFANVCYFLEHNDGILRATNPNPNDAAGINGPKNRVRQFICETRNWQPWSTPKLALCPAVDAADAGDLTKQYEVAMNYYYGDNGFPVNYRECVKYLRLAAAQHHWRAEMLLGDLTVIGIARPRSFRTARELFERAASSGELVARTRYGLYLEWWNRLIASNRQELYDYAPYLHGHDGRSLLRYGQILEGNENTTLGLREALVCYRQAVQVGSLDSFRRMFHCLHELRRLDEIIDEHFDAILMVHDIPMIKILARTIGQYDPRVDRVLFVLRGLNARHLEEFSRASAPTSLHEIIRLCKKKIMDRLLHRWPTQSLVGSLNRLAQIYVANPRIKERLKHTDGTDTEANGVRLVHILFEHVINKITERYDLTGGQYDLRLYKEGITPVV
jgi:TPR repeat protein